MNRVAVGFHVGFDVGLMGLPDIADRNRLSSLQRRCRKCRAVQGERYHRRHRYPGSQLLERSPKSSQVIDIVGLE